MAGPYLQVHGTWEMVQKNGFKVLLHVNQDRDLISASASHSNGRVQSLEATGFVRGPNFDLTITWDNNTKGHYTGKWVHGHFTQPPIGYLAGNTVDLINPESQAIWNSEGMNFYMQ